MKLDPGRLDDQRIYATEVGLTLTDDELATDITTARTMQNAANSSPIAEPQPLVGEGTAAKPAQTRRTK